MKAKKPTKIAAKNRPADETYRILLIDDDRDSTDALSLLLKREGHQVEVTHDGESAKGHALHFQPQAIVLDIGLPGKNGYDVAKDLRQEDTLRDVVIVALSGYGDDHHRKKSFDAGIDEHMTKPIEVPVLLNRIAQGRKPST